MVYVENISQCQANIIIEAVVEKIEIKWQLLQKLAAFNDAQTILASNTSSLSINSIAAHIPGPERVIGLHYFIPAPVRKIVVVVKADQTNQFTINAAIALVKQMNKTPEICRV